MNTDNLHELINRYEEHIDTIYSAEHDELFKWKSLKQRSNRDSPKMGAQNLPQGLRRKKQYG